jgi:membrane protease YdiL (CAAX protease family)
MPDLPSAATIIQNAQWALALLGLGLAGAWYFAPRCQPLRRRPARVPPWSADVPDTLLVGFVVCLAVLLGLSFASTVTLRNGLTTSDGWTSVIFALGLHGTILATVASLALYKRSVGEPLPPAGSTPPAPLTDRLLLGAAVLCAALPFVFAASYTSAEAMELLKMEVKRQDLAGFFTTSSPPLVLISLTLVATVLAPLSEELLFRAGLFRILASFLPRWAAILVSAMAFASLHQSTVHFLPLTVLGVIFALAYEKSGSLLVPVVAHGLFNLNSILNLLAGLGT